MPPALKYLVLLGLLVLLAAAGLASGLLELPVALQLNPTELTCQEYTRDPAQSRWVELRGCRLQLAGRLGDQHSGLFGVRDGAELSAVFLAVHPSDEAQEDPRPISVLLESRQPRLLSFAREVDRLQTEQIAYRLRQLAPVLLPQTVTGYVRPLSGLEAAQAKEALGTALAQNAVVLTEGSPQSAWGTLLLLAALVGFAGLVVAATRKPRAPTVDALGLSRVKVELGALEALRRDGADEKKDP